MTVPVALSAGDVARVKEQALAPQPAQPQQDATPLPRVLDPRDPLAIARRFVSERYMRDGAFTLYA
jgi:hypothetical protein